MGFESMTTAADWDTSLYPAAYRVPLWRGLARVTAYFSLFALAVFGRAQILRNGHSLWLMIFIVAMGALLVVVVANTVFARVVLYSDRIERITWFGKKTLKRDQVKSLRRSKRYLGLIENSLLISKVAYDESILLPNAVHEDHAWSAWMNSVPAEERK